MKPNSTNNQEKNTFLQKVFAAFAKGNSLLQTQRSFGKLRAYICGVDGETDDEPCPLPFGIQRGSTKYYAFLASMFLLLLGLSYIMVKLQFFLKYHHQI